MPRRARSVWPGCPYHAVQKDNRGEPVFDCEADFRTYLGLLKRAQANTGVKVLAYALMNNHVHLILIPPFHDTMARLFQYLSGTYAQWFNAGRGLSGRLWQTRYYAAPMSPLHLHHALRYVELNPVRARISNSITGYRWTSAPAHCSGIDPWGILEMELLTSKGGPQAWRSMLERGARDPREREIQHLLRACTYAERPFGDESFIAEVEQQLQVQYRRWPFQHALESDDAAYSLEHLAPSLGVATGD